jgi:Coenzyme PQQ synthesis protein D (PqqD)
VTKNSKGAVNLLELKPVRNVQSTSNPDGTIVLIVPKFQGKFASRWFMPTLSKPNIQLKLDAHGSFFWNECDGRKSVREIAGKMSGHFGEEIEPMLDRVGTFMRKLDESKFILIDGSSEAAEIETVNQGI